MSARELSGRLIRDAGFRMLPLLGSIGHTGLHFHRFTAHGVIDVVQVWDDTWAIFARLRDLPNWDSPYLGHDAIDFFSGSFADVVDALAPSSRVP